MGMSGIQLRLNPFEHVTMDGRADKIYREVRVRPYNPARETLLVFFVSALIILFMGIRFIDVSTKTTEPTLRPYQRFHTAFSESQNTLYRAMLSSLTDILALRDQEGLWPEADLLAMENIPPFYSQLLPKALRGYRWVGYDGGSWIDYLGQDVSGQQSVTFILRLIDLHAGYHPHPHPGIDYDPELTVAAQVWSFPEAQRPYPGERLPEAGWFWIVQPDDPVLTQPASQNSTQTNPSLSPLDVTQQP